MSSFCLVMTVLTLAFKQCQSCPKGYTHCAIEGGVCTLAELPFSTNVIAYGKDGHRFHTQKITGAFTCANNALCYPITNPVNSGTDCDPSQGTSKECCYRDTAISSVPSGASTTGVDWGLSIQCMQAVGNFVSHADEEHIYEFINPQTQDVQFSNCGSDISDTTLYLYDSAGNSLMGDTWAPGSSCSCGLFCTTTCHCDGDDCATAACSASNTQEIFDYYDLPAGTYYIRFTSFGSSGVPGGYTLRVECADTNENYIYEQNVATCTTAVNSATSTHSRWEWFVLNTNSKADITFKSCGSGYDTTVRVFEDSLFYDQLTPSPEVDNDDCSSGFQETYTLGGLDPGQYYIAFGTAAGCTNVGNSCYGSNKFSVNCAYNYPTADPTPAPLTPTPPPVTTLAPTPAPTAYPTPAPTPAPTGNPIPAPTGSPTPAPTKQPTPAPTDNPTPAPTKQPTPAPTQQPTPAPTPAPTEIPTPAPTTFPTPAPTDIPTPAPTGNPTKNPTTPRPTEPDGLFCGDSDSGAYTGVALEFNVQLNYYAVLTFDASASEFGVTTIEAYFKGDNVVLVTDQDNDEIVTLPFAVPADYSFFIGGDANGQYAITITCVSDSPTPAPTEIPTPAPTNIPTPAPTGYPTPAPTEIPTAAPTEVPTPAPTEIPTPAPTEIPTPAPTDEPTPAPTNFPTVDPTKDPTAEPTIDPTLDPTMIPSNDPTMEPTVNPTAGPTAGPTADPTPEPTPTPTAAPSLNPTLAPSYSPTTAPTHQAEVETTSTTTEAASPEETKQELSVKEHVTGFVSSTNNLLMMILIAIGALICMCCCFVCIYARHKSLKRRHRKNINMSQDFGHLKSSSTPSGEGEGPDFQEGGTTTTGGGTPGTTAPLQRVQSMSAVSTGTSIHDDVYGAETDGQQNITAVEESPVQGSTAPSRQASMPQSFANVFQANMNPNMGLNMQSQMMMQSMNQTMNDPALAMIINAPMMGMGVQMANMGSVRDLMPLPVEPQDNGSQRNLMPLPAEMGSQRNLMPLPAAPQDDNLMPVPPMVGNYQQSPGGPSEAYDEKEEEYEEYEDDGYEYYEEEEEDGNAGYDNMYGAGKKITDQ